MQARRNNIVFLSVTNLQHVFDIAYDINYRLPIKWVF